MMYFEDVIRTIEDNLLTDIDMNALAKQAGLSLYEFRRIFAFVTKMPPGEYVRKRRLSLSALALYGKKVNLSDIVDRYGYDSPSSFSRAFKEFHGVSPTEVMNGNGNFRLLTRVNVEIVTSGCAEIEYHICDDTAFTVAGLFGTSTSTDTACCEDVWSAFYKNPLSEDICAASDTLYAVYQTAGETVRCHIGTRDGDFAETVVLPASRWACFTLKGTEDDAVNRFYLQVLNQWFASTGYTRNTALPNIEVYPSDMSADDFSWEIRIPIKE